MGEQKSTAKQVAFMGMLLALALTLSYVEMIITPMLGLAPGVKLGLANVAGMYALFCLGYKEALTLSVLRSVFVFLMRGVTSFFMSVTGGLCSIAVMIVLHKLLKDKLSYITYSVLGAVTHNLAQLAMAGILLQTPLTYYGPVLLISGVIVGVLTGITLKTVMPALENLQKRL